MKNAFAKASARHEGKVELRMHYWQNPSHKMINRNLAARLMGWHIYSYDSATKKWTSSGGYY